MLLKCLTFTLCFLHDLERFGCDERIDAFWLDEGESFIRRIERTNHEKCRVLQPNCVVSFVSKVIISITEFFLYTATWILLTIHSCNTGDVQ